jgi:N-methylhydantoinase A
MAKRHIRVGIDVGGTFTDAVAIDNDTLEIVNQVKVHTTHRAKAGVAEGVIQALIKLLEQGHFASDEIVFIAHGTTQATNALLEGDVAATGIVGMGHGIDGLRARGETDVEDMELARGRILHTFHTWLDTTRPPSDEAILAAIDDLVKQGAQAIVAAEAYSVDDPTNEQHVMDVTKAKGLPGCGSHQISKRYGLKARTRTAVINASILPTMIRTADMTESSVRQAGIGSPLMIMRGDGGAMSIDEMRSRPILTLLSGPAAGVAGALMYARISEGVFLEVGGTSTDISAIKNGQVAIDYAVVGGHRTYLPSLDIRTAGLAGGSMIRLREGKIAEVGPRSAHIAGLEYSVFSDPAEFQNATLEIVKPLPTDPEEYVAVRGASGELYALTLSCAANVAGLCPEGDYAHGNVEAARLAFAPLAARLGLSVDETVSRTLDVAVSKVVPLVEELVDKHGLARANTVLVGGGGGASTVVPYAAKKMGLRHELAKNNQVISTIGVALAMVRDMVERTIVNPSQEDILRVRKEAEQAVLAMGAQPETVQVQVEVDNQLNLVRAIATGTTELRSKDLTKSDLSPEERQQAAAESLGLPAEQCTLFDSTGRLDLYGANVCKSRLFGLLKDWLCLGRVVDAQGIVRLKLANFATVTTTLADVQKDLAHLVDQTATYGEGGRQMPNVIMLYGPRWADLGGLATPEQIIAIACEEIKGCRLDEKVILIADKR